VISNRFKQFIRLTSMVVLVCFLPQQTCFALAPRAFKGRANHRNLADIQVAEVLGAMNDYTREHTERVLVLAQAIGQELDLNIRDQGKVEEAALAHDFGGGIARTREYSQELKDKVFRETGIELSGPHNSSQSEEYQRVKAQVVVLRESPSEGLPLEEINNILSVLFQIDYTFDQLKQAGIIIDDDVREIISAHHSFSLAGQQGFLAAILIAADVIENGQNQERRENWGDGRNAETLSESLGYLRQRFQDEEIYHPQVIAAAESVLFKMANGQAPELLDVVYQARQETQPLADFEGKVRAEFDNWVTEIHSEWKKLNEDIYSDLRWLNSQLSAPGQLISQRKSVVTDRVRNLLGKLSTRTELIAAEEAYLRAGESNLHAHSSDNHGDGELTAQELCALAEEAGITSLTICQHNTLEGSKQAVAFAQSAERPFVTHTASEVSLAYEIDGGDPVEGHFKVYIPHEIDESGTVKVPEKLEQAIKLVDQNMQELVWTFYELVVNFDDEVSNAGLDSIKSMLINENGYVDSDNQILLNEIKRLFEELKVFNQDLSRRNKTFEQGFRWFDLYDIGGYWTTDALGWDNDEQNLFATSLMALFSLGKIEAITGKRLIRIEEFMESIASTEDSPERAMTYKAHWRRDIKGGLVTEDVMVAKLEEWAKVGWIQGVETRYISNAEADDTVSDSLVNRISALPEVAQFYAEGTASDFHQLAHVTEGRLVFGEKDADSYFRNGDYLAQPFIEQAVI